MTIPQESVSYVCSMPNVRFASDPISSRNLTSSSDPLLIACLPRSQTSQHMSLDRIHTARTVKLPGVISLGLALPEQNKCRTVGRSPFLLADIMSDDSDTTFLTARLAPIIEK